MQYDPKLDRMIWHDYPGVHGPQITKFILDEIELGARVALHLDDPLQTFWALEDMRNVHRLSGFC